MANEEAIDCNKNLRMYMRLSDKNQPCKFSEENYIALDLAIQALEQIDKIKQIIAIDNSVIQEDVMKYKMICEVVEA